MEHGFTWSDGLVRAARRFEASITRGIGPGRQSEPLDFDRLARMDLPVEAPLKNGPVGVPQVVVLFTHFFLREVEGSFAVVEDWHIDEAVEELTWRLPASKSDPMAKGCSRTWGCTCAADKRTCPYHAALAQLTLLRERFGADRVRGRCPLFPDGDGNVVEAEVMVELVEFLASLLGLPLTTPAGNK